MAFLEFNFFYFLENGLRGNSSISQGVGGDNFLVGVFSQGGFWGRRVTSILFFSSSGDMNGHEGGYGGGGRGVEGGGA